MSKRDRSAGKMKEKKKKGFFFRHQKDYDTGKIIPSENPLHWCGWFNENNPLSKKTIFKGMEDENPSTQILILSTI